MIDVLIGLQWGDEGKGKIVDMYAPNYDMVARFQGGPNAGHTLVIDGKKYILHTIPSGIIHPNTLNIVGTGTVIDPVTLMKEVDFLKAEHIAVEERLIISDKAILIMPSHKMLDEYFEKSKGEQKIGSTLRGIGPAYQDKYARIALRIGDIFNADFDKQYQALKAQHLIILKSYGINEADLEKLQADEINCFEAIERMRKLRVDVIEDLINDGLSKGSKILAEGAQGSLLDITFGSYPFVTSSNTISASACIGLGVAPQKIDRVIGVFKAYMTRVGSGPFPSELDNEIGETLRVKGFEFGATTGRKRRCGWLDLNLLKRTIIQNGVTDLVITKSDVLNCLPEFSALSTDGQLHSFPSWTEELSTITQYDALPENFKSYISFIENDIQLGVNVISTGPQRSEIIIR
ncbi:adenylosuccinate synthase [bacterium]|nr:adenylosuccinate synthase [bacterium]